MHVGGVQLDNTIANQCISNGDTAVFLWAMYIQGIHTYTKKSEFCCKGAEAKSCNKICHVDVLIPLYCIRYTARVPKRASLTNTTAFASTKRIKAYLSQV